MNHQVYLSVGTNQGDREQYLKSAMLMIDNHPEISLEEFSSIYETAPVGYAEQPNFLNMVVYLKTSLSALLLLDFLQGVENELGRKRDIRWGPRTIDLDILLFNKENIKSERLTVPHPRMFERAFVMVPLLEVNGDLINIENINIEGLIESQPLRTFIGRNDLFNEERGE